MLFYDIPDGHPLIHQFLDALRRELSPVSVDIVLEQLKEVADYGWIQTECKPLEQGIIGLDAPIGYGKKARILFFETPRGDYMALHAFTIASSADAAQGLSIAAKRMEDLIG
jgi:phage-related protein